MIVHPSLMETIDLDERAYSDDFAADLRRCYLSIGPVRVHRHTATDPAHNVMELSVHMAKKYWRSSDEGADELWDSVREWLASKTYFVGSTIRNFNASRAERGDQTVDYDRLDVAMGPITLQFALVGNELPAIDRMADALRAQLNAGAFGDVEPVRVLMPSQRSYEEQLAAHASPVAAGAAGDAPGEAGAAGESRGQGGAAGAEPGGRQATDDGAGAAGAREAVGGGQARDDGAGGVADGPAAGAGADAPAGPWEVDRSVWGVVDAQGEVREFDSLSGTWA
ncbi:MAG: hypothetical protein SOI26_03775 [Coriobacteriales bacterium]|jgi:hypothetical protein